MEGVVWRTTSLIICNIAVWKDVKRWLKLSVIARLLRRSSCSENSCLKKNSMSTLNIYVCFLVF